MPGDVITAEPGFLRGHGTLLTSDGKLIATVRGTVERVNKLISVRPIKSRYQGEVGDVVVGRVVEVVAKRWKVDINAKQEAALLLSSIHLPGGVQRRKTQEDELNMRTFFTEHDLICAEVHSLFTDGGASLHMRSAKYRKLTEPGIFLTVQSQLIQRAKAHFHTLPCGVDIILGQNGCIWITESSNLPSSSDGEEMQFLPMKKQISAAVRENIARVRNSIVALSLKFVPISPQSIMDTFESSVQLNVHPKDIVRPDIIDKVTSIDTMMDDFEAEYYDENDRGVLE